MVVGRIHVVLVLALALTAGLSAAQGVTYLEQTRTKCWDCHVDDYSNVPAPVRTFWNVKPPESAAIDGVTAYEVTIQNAWYHDVTYLEPTLDLTNAPSLALFDDRAPFEDHPAGVVQRPQPTVELPEGSQILPTVSGVTDPARGYVNTTLPSGATSLLIEMHSLDTQFSPEVAWFLHPGEGEPGDEPAFGPIYGDADGVARFAIEETAGFQGVGYGLWAIEAVVPPTNQAGQPNPFGPSLAIRADVAARFDASDTRASIQSRSLLLEPFQTTLFEWQLVRAGVAGPNEFVVLDVKGTAFWEHQASSNAIDEEHMSVRFELAVQDDAGTPAIRPSADLLIVIVPDLSAGASIVTISEAVGYASAFMIIASIYTGGMFGKASRRGLNRLFGGAKRRVAFHNFLSYGLTAAAIAHTVLFLYSALSSSASSWTLGLIWGGLAILAMFGLGVTGAMQVPLIRRWNYAAWRWTHYGLAVAAIVFTLLHMLLDGAHFGSVQEWIGWQNPLDFRPEAGR